LRDTRAREAARLAFILAVLSTIRDLKALFEEQVGLRCGAAEIRRIAQNAPRWPEN
jgi:hypothetical protein